MLPAKVKIARLHSAVGVPNGFGVNNNLSEDKQPGIKMELHDFGLLVTIGGQIAIIPSPNIQLVLLEPANESSPKTKSK